jgi:hypothetical protein
MILQKTLISLFLFAICNTSFAITVLDQKNFTFKNSDCEKTNSCDLDNISFERVNYRVDFSSGEYNFGSRIISKYKTKKAEDLKNYVFVQYIKGCQFHSRMEAGESGALELKKNRSIQIISFGEYIPYLFHDWTIDSMDLDPVYNSDAAQADRHYFYRWNTVTGSTDYSTEYYMGETDQKPKDNELYVIDRPGTAFNQYEATNISLQFKMCLYKTAQIPLTATKDQGIYENPIYCYDWNSSFIYDFKTQKFNSPTELDPFCR